MKQLRNKLAVFVATWFYTGLIPPVILNGMAGTYGSFFSLPLVWGALWLAKISLGYYWFVGAIIFFLGLWSILLAQIALWLRKDWKGRTKTRDQNQIVIDETFGMLVTFYSLPTSHHSIWLIMFIGFALFRFFDIIKIPPANWFDRMKNPAGVMLDDFAAGVQANICLRLAIRFLGL